MTDRSRGTKRAAIYLRISLDKTGEGLAVARQREDCEQLIKLRGWQLAAVHTDNSVSAAGAKRRPGFTALLDAIEAGEVDVVVAWALDRLTRNAKDRLALVELCRTHGVIIALVRGSDLDPTTPAGRFTLGVLGEVAQMEIDQKADRQRRASQQAAEMGKAPQALRAFGWVQDRSALVPEEAEAIEQAYRDVLRGASLAEIARRWNAAGLRSARHNGDAPPNWSAETVKVLMINPRNAGIRAVREAGNSLRFREIGPAVWPAIVDEGTFRAVATLLTDPSRRGAPPAAQRLLSGVARCGRCGGSMEAGRTTEGKQTYRCASKRHVARQAAPVDEFVIDLIVGRLSAPDARDLLDDRERADIDALRDERRALTIGLEALAAERGQRLATADPMDLSEYAALRAPSLARLDEIEKLIADAGRVDVLGDLVAAEDVRALWEDPAFGRGRQRAVVATLLDIVVHPAGSGARYFDPATIQVEWKV